jgi:hypothetical protein
MSDDKSLGKGEAKDLLEEARTDFSEAQESESENRKDALDDLKFGRLGEQWPDGIKRQRELEQRPCLTINKMPTFSRH